MGTLRPVISTFLEAGRHKVGGTGTSCGIMGTHCPEELLPKLIRFHGGLRSVVLPFDRRNN